nr:unnamed protein product [Callosobruchus chinensis]
MATKNQVVVPVMVEIRQGVGSG